MALNYSEMTKQMSISLVSNEVSLLNSPEIMFSNFTAILNPDAKQNFHLLFNKYAQVKTYLTAKAAQMGSQIQMPMF